MKKSKFAEKVVDKIEDMLLERNWSNDYTLDNEIRTINGVKHPFLTIESDRTERKSSIDLFSAYNRHEEEEISISDSIGSVKIHVTDFVNGDIGLHYQVNGEWYHSIDEFDALHMPNHEEDEENEIEDEEAYENDFEDTDSDEFDISPLLDSIPVLDPSEEPVFSVRFLNVDRVSPSLLRNVVVLQECGDLCAVVYYKTPEMDDRTLLFKDDAIRHGRTDDDLREVIANKINEHSEILHNANVSSEYCYASADVLMCPDAMNRVKDELGSQYFWILFTPDEYVHFIKLDDLSLSGAREALNTINDIYLNRGHGIATEHVYAYNYDSNLLLYGSNLLLAIDPERERHNLNTEDNVATYVRPTLHSVLQGENTPAEQEPETEVDSPDMLTTFVDFAAAQVLEQPDLYHSDEQIHDANYYADYDTNSATEFAETMKDFFNWRLGNGFHLEGNMLVNANNTIRMDMNDANHEYQTNEMDFLQFGDVLVDEYNHNEAALIASEPAGQPEEDLDYDDQLPFF